MPITIFEHFFSQKQTIFRQTLFGDFYSTLNFISNGIQYLKFLSFKIFLIFLIKSMDLEEKFWKILKLKKYLCIIYHLKALLMQNNNCQIILPEICLCLSFGLKFTHVIHQNNTFSQKKKDKFSMNFLNNLHK